MCGEEMGARMGDLAGCILSASGYFSFVVNW